MADTGAHSGSESRSERSARSRRAMRFRIGAGVAVLVVLLVVGALGAGRWYGARLSAAPDYVVVVAESELEDGTKTAGVVAVIERTGDGFDIQPVDATQPRPIPGTSFESLREALPMGGPALVARLVAADIDGAEQPAWLFLDQQGWAGVLSAAGDVTIEFEERLTAFTGEELYRFEVGRATLSGHEATVMLLAADSLEDQERGGMLRDLLGEKLAEAVISEPDAVNAAIEDGLGEYSGSEVQLRNFLTP